MDYALEQWINGPAGTIPPLDAVMKVVAAIPTGEGPHEVAVSDDGKTAVVCNYGTGPNPGSTLSIVDVAAHKELRRVTLPGLYRPHPSEVSGEAWRA